MQLAHDAGQCLLVDRALSLALNPTRAVRGIGIQGMLLGYSQGLKKAKK